MGAPQFRRRFPKGPPGKETAVPERACRIDQQDIEVSEKRPVLIAVIEDQAVGAETLDGGLPGEKPFRSRQNGDSRKGAGDQDRFISRLLPSQQQTVPVGDDIHGGLGTAAVTSAQDGRPTAMSLQQRGDQNDGGGLPGSAYGEVSYADHGTCELPLPENSQVIETVSQKDDVAVRDGERAQQGTRNGGPVPGSFFVPDLLNPGRKRFQGSPSFNP